ncbi:hypothetical protein SRHO_G00321910 [Serrasalmus rhombeus]
MKKASRPMVTKAASGGGKAEGITAGLSAGKTSTKSCSTHPLSKHWLPSLTLDQLGPRTILVPRPSSGIFNTHMMGVSPASWKRNWVICLNKIFAYIPSSAPVSISS